LEKPTSTDMKNCLCVHCSFNQSVQTILEYHVYINFITNLEEEILNDHNKSLSTFSQKYNIYIYFCYYICTRSLCI